MRTTPPLLALLLLSGCSSDPTAPPKGGPPAAEKKAPAGPSAAKEGLEWTHRELFTYLDGKGVRVQRSTFSEGDEPVVLIWENQPAAQASRVQVQRKADEKGARVAAGALGESGFAWGAFVFHSTHGRHDLLRKIRAALP